MTRRFLRAALWDWRTVVMFITAIVLGLLIASMIRGYQNDQRLANLNVDNRAAASRRIDQLQAQIASDQALIQSNSSSIGQLSAEIAALQEQIKQMCAGKTNCAPVVTPTTTTTPAPTRTNAPQSPQSPAKPSPGTTTPPNSSPPTTSPPSSPPTTQPSTPPTTQPPPNHLVGCQSTPLGQVCI